MSGEDASHWSKIPASVSWRGMRIVIVAFALIAISLAGIAFNSPIALAYDGSQAAQWADQHATDRSGMWTSFWEDCTNFVSEAMDRGGNAHEVGDMWHNSEDDTSA